MKKIILMFILGILLISSVYASCTVTNIERNVNVGETPPSQLTLCQNTENFTIIAYKSGGFFSTSSETPITIGAGNTAGITINFQQMNNIGLYEGLVYFSDVLSPITIKVNVSGIVIPQQNYSAVIVFPTAKVINVVQGQTKNQNIQVIVPSNYPRSITIQSVSFNPDLDVVRFGDLDLGILNPGQTLNIPLIIDAKNVQTGNYNTQVSILATDTQGQVQLSPSNLQIVVSAGVSPGNGTLIRPSCSLSAIEFSLNSSVTFTCSNVVSNLEVNPQYNEYIEGINADLTPSGTYSYIFRGLKYGNTKFIATFNFKGSPIFTYYSQDIKITPSGSNPVMGTNLRVVFFQNGIKRGLIQLNQGETIINIVDNKTDSLINSYTILLNGVQVNSTVNFEVDKTYELRVSVPGYVDLVISNLTVLKNQLSITLNPLKEFYEINDLVNLSCNFDPCSYLLNDAVIPSLYTPLSSGTFSIKAVKDGYIETIKNISVKSLVQILTMNPTYDEWGKGDDVVIEIDKNSTWNVLRDADVLASGEGTTIKFDSDGYGNYVVNVNNAVLTSKNLIKTSNWYNPFSWGMRWYVWIGIFIGIIVAVFIVRRYRGEKEEEKPSYEYNV